ncbi:unnamed protein product [Plutella xylostella]|uniref:(diamondback moth) hypothetical protein n=1 Tax=Plutella xylostella TaxID=51655 RepID=A0A8S4G4H7_PLUXY|nr:unnamed protein product [Plutella xylostella]CAG9137580.1 unnamed protein product [Plutella xylostella]
MTKCGMCKKYIPRGDIAKCAKCAKCSSPYHPYCIKEGEGVIPVTWTCPACSKDKAVEAAPSAPVRPASLAPSVAAAPPASPAPPATSAPPSTPATPSPRRGAPELLELPEPVAADHRLNSTANDTTEEFKVELGLEIRLFREALTEVKEEIRLFRSEVMELKSSFIASDQRLTELGSRVDILEKRVTDGTGSRLEAVIAELRQDLNDKDQELLDNDVEITNLPEENGENPTHIVLSVAVKLGVQVQESDIVSAERVGPRNRWHQAPSGESGAGAGAGAGRPRPLVVRLTRRALKDQLIAAARVRRGATSADLGQSSAPRPFYVNERLTKVNRQLFHQVREVGRRQSWRFMWTKKGRIYARQGQDSPRHWIRKTDDIVRVFGVTYTL